MTAFFVPDHVQTSNTLLVGNTTVNVAVNSSVVAVNGNLYVNSTTLHIGNSTVNSSIDATAYKLNGVEQTVTSGMQYLGTGTAVGVSTADIDLSDYISDGYKTFEILGSGFRSTTNTIDLRLRVSTDGGSTFESGSNYDAMFASIYRNGSYSATDSNYNDVNIDYYRVADTVGNTSSTGIMFRLYIFNAASAIHYTRIFHRAQWGTSSSGNAQLCMSAGTYGVTQDTDAIRLYPHTGTLANGSYWIYGYQH